MKNTKRDIETKNNLVEFIRRGLAFGGFGPIVLAAIYLILSYSLENFSLNGKEVFLGIISTYLLAFVHAGVSVFNQIESWSIAKATLFHLGTLYIAYTVCYLLNSWIPFKWSVLLIYTAVFVIGYMAIWLAVVLSIKAVSCRLNKMLGGANAPSGDNKK